MTTENHIFAFVADGVRFDGPTDYTFRALDSFQLEMKEAYSLAVRCFPEDAAEYWRKRCRSRGDEFAGQAEELAKFFGLRDYPVVELHGAPGHVFWFSRWMECLLRLFAPGHIRAIYPTVLHDDTSGAWEAPWDQKYAPWPGDYVVPAARLLEFFAFVDGLTAVIKKHPATSIAFRYFTRSYSLGRLSGNGRSAGSDEHLETEDAILLLTVALEALFAFGQKDELAFKLRTRAARFLSADDVEGCRILALLKWAYDVRSQVAHGDFRGFKLGRELEAAFAGTPTLAPPLLAEYLRNVVRIALLATANSLRGGWTRERIQSALDFPFPSKELFELRRFAAIPTAPGCWPPAPTGASESASHR